MVKIMKLFFFLLIANIFISNVNAKNYNINSIIKDKSGFYYPSNRWAYQHMDKIYKYLKIKNNPTNLHKWEFSIKDLDNIKIKVDNSSYLNINQILKRTYTDAFLVIKDGKIVYENYLNGQNKKTKHQMMSVTKSIVATSIYSLIDDGKINKFDKAIKYVPELKNTAWEDSTIENILDMTTSLSINEDYDDPNNDFDVYINSMNLNNLYKNKLYDGMLDFLKSVKKNNWEHGYKFNYITANTDVLCLIAQKVLNKQPYQFISEYIWSKIGANDEAFILTDQYGNNFCGAGLNATTRDLGLFGMMIANNGQINGSQIISKNFIDELKKGGSHEQYNRGHYNTVPFLKGWTYKNQWWIKNNHIFVALGIYGQMIYINIKENIVIVRQSSRKVAVNDDDGIIFKLAEAITNFLHKK